HNTHSLALGKQANIKDQGPKTTHRSEIESSHHHLLSVRSRRLLMSLVVEPIIDHVVFIVELRLKFERTLDGALVLLHHVVGTSGLNSLLEGIQMLLEECLLVVHDDVFVDVDGQLCHVDQLEFPFLLL
ncbi:hypothetical protein PMAYCL1PPCAC_26810, partial [Pristionchus mayeri]